jgi:hypothetical protein
MTNLSERLREEIDDAIRQVYKEWKANAIHTAKSEDVARAAEYAVSDLGIMMALNETGAWQKVVPERRQSVLLLRCVEHVLEKWER